LRDRYRDRASEYQAQIEQELKIITAVGYEEYFLVVWGILQDCRQHGIEWITRDSAADSLVCYCHGISDVCPIRFGLYFRRFLNEERMALNKLPDIDVDYEPPNCVRWRDETHQTTGKLNAKENLRVFSYNETIFPLMPYDGASALPRQNNTP
jgi:hypothetical protein